MISWIVIIVLLVIAFFVLKFNHLKHRFWLIMIILFALFLVGELSNGHNLEMLFYFFALMSGMQIAQKIKGADRGVLIAPSDLAR